MTVWHITVSGCAWGGVYGHLCPKGCDFLELDYSLHVRELSLRLCAPCAPVYLSTSRMALGKFWGPLASVSLSLPTTHLSWLRCSMGMFVCVCDGEKAGQGTLW